MSRTGDLYIEAHEELMAKYLEDNPDATEDEAYEATAEAVYEHVQDRLEDIADRKYEEAKERRRESKWSE